MASKKKKVTKKKAGTAALKAGRVGTVKKKAGSGKKAGTKKSLTLKKKGASPASVAARGANLEAGMAAQAAANEQRLARRKLDALRKGIHKVGQGQEEKLSLHVIGLGKAGAAVLEQIGKDVSDTLVNNHDMRFSGLALDIGGEDLKGVKELREILPEGKSHIETVEINVPPREELFSTLRRMREFLKLEYPRYYWNPNYEPWLPSSIDIEPLNGESSYPRALSKALYAKAYYDGERPVAKALKRFSDSVDASPGSSVVVVIFSMGGGTGSGIVVDLARHLSNVSFGRRALVLGIGIAPCSGDQQEHSGAHLFPLLNELDCMGDRKKNDGVITVWGDLYRNPFTSGVIIVPQEPIWSTTQDLGSTHQRVNEEISSFVTRQFGGDLWESLRLLNWVGAPPTQHAAARTPMGDNWIHLLGFSDQKTWAAEGLRKSLGVRETYKCEYIEIRADADDQNHASVVADGLGSAFNPVATPEISETTGTVKGSVQYILPCVSKTDFDQFFQARHEYDQKNWEDKLMDHSWLLDLGVLLSEPAIRFNGMAGECLWGCACWVVVPYDQLRGPEN
jgi:hypothetical protein